MKKTSFAASPTGSMPPAVSVSPDGEIFPLPPADDYARESSRLKMLADEQRAQGRRIVVVMGVGFVGPVMAGVVADSVDKATGDPLYRPSSRPIPTMPFLFRVGV